MPITRPQRLCAHEPCQAVALTSKRYCKRHAAERTRSRVQRANAIRHEKWLPENRSIIGIVERYADCSAEIASSANNLAHALEKNKIDRPRAALLYGCLQLSHSVQRITMPKDPNRRAAAQALCDLALTLAVSKGGLTNNR